MTAGTDGPSGVGGRLRGRRPASVAALMAVARRQESLVAEMREFQETLARERAGIRAELTAITARLDSCEARLDAGDARHESAVARLEAGDERIDLAYEAMSGAATLARQSRRRLLRLEEALGLPPPVAGDRVEPTPAGDS